MEFDKVDVERAGKEGVYARKVGLGADANPYSFDSERPLHRAWLENWVYAGFVPRPA